MKEPLKLPFIFLFILICATFVLAVLDMLSVWGMYDSASRAFGFSYAAQKLPLSVSRVMIPAVVLSIVLLGFRMARRPFSRFVGLLIVLGVSYVVLVNGMIFSNSLASSARSLPETPRQYIVPSTFVRLGDRIVAVRSLEGANARGILVYDSSRTDERFTVRAQANVTTRKGTLTLTTSGPSPVSLSGSPALAWSSVFAPDRFTSLFLRDVRTLTVDFQKLMDTSMAEFFAACFSLVFLCAASLMLLRITRWPLVNVMLLVIAVRGYFSLYHLLAVSIAPQIAAVVTDRLAARLFPSAAMAALGVLLLLLDILFIPGDRWTREGTT